MQPHSSELMMAGQGVSAVDAQLRTYVRSFLKPLVPGVLVGLALAVSALTGLVA